MAIFWPCGAVLTAGFWAILVNVILEILDRPEATRVSLF